MPTGQTPVANAIRNLFGLCYEKTKVNGNISLVQIKTKLIAGRDSPL